MVNLEGVGFLIVIGFIAIIVAIIMGIYGIIDYFCMADKYESSELVKPEVVIKSVNRNGVITSDTTYIYT